MSTINHRPGGRVFRLISQFVLIAVPLFLFPITLLALSYNYAALLLVPQNGLRHQIRRSSRFKPQIILVTGISTPAGLRIARAFFQTGHVVVGADSNRSGDPSHARWSRAITKYHKINQARHAHEYIKSLLDIITKDRVSLWIDASHDSALQTWHAQTRQVVERRTACVCLVPDLNPLEIFQTRHDLAGFAQSLGLLTLDTHRVRSRGEIHNVLQTAKGKKYQLTGPSGALVSTTSRGVLPRRTPSQTYQDVSQIKITRSSPWILEQWIDGLARYSTFAIVIQGVVQAFVAFSRIDTGLRVLPSTTGIAQVMRSYVEEFAARAGDHVSGQVMLEFCVDEKTGSTDVIQQTLLVGGQLCASEALVLFAGRQGSIDLTKSYLSVLASSINGLGSFTGLPLSQSTEHGREPDTTETGLYHIDQNAYLLLVVPLLQWMSLQIGAGTLLRSVVKFINQLCFWREAVYEFWDPLPAFWLYLVYTPANLRRWYRMTL